MAENLFVHLWKICIYTHTVNVIQSSKYWIWRQQEYKHVMKNNSSISACCHIHKWYSQEWNYCSLEKKKINKKKHYYGTTTKKKSHHQIQRGNYTQWIDASKYGVHFLMCHTCVLIWQNFLVFHTKNCNNFRHAWKQLSLPRLLLLLLSLSVCNKNNNI